MKRLYVKLMYKNGKVRKLHTEEKLKRILYQVSLGKYQKAYVRVSYGKKKCIHGCLCEFHNDGYYTDPKEVKDVIYLFLNEE